ncbi:MAG: sulfatase-like hydrolase/transferase [Opitutaceae bacterium]|nr:sulfatase-like hydrolase/transferase [Opitutaceae bacterium]
MPNPPNILLLLSDQHNATMAGFAGDRVVRTRNLDALATRSVRCATTLCASPVCTPSRMSMLTGKEPHRCAAWNNHWMIFPEHATWPGHFAAHGYTTVLVGKMHFGGRDQYQGFQHRPYGDLRHGLGHQPEPIDLFPGYAHVRSAGVSEIPESLMQDVVVVRETRSFLLEHQSQHPDRPWFACASFSRPHSPLTAPGRYIRRYTDKVPLPNLAEGEPGCLEPFARLAVPSEHPSREEERRALEAYYASIDFLDDCIGELLASLDRSGLLDNTIVIYTSDHGEMAGSHGLWGKRVYYESSVAVPLLVSGPGVKPGAHVWHDPVSLIDLFPTTCALAGLPIPLGLDGIDQSPALRDPEGAAAPRAFASSSYFDYGIRINRPRSADDAPARAMRLVRTRGWKFVQVEKGAELLFNLREDPEERLNRMAEAAQAGRIDSMRAMLEQGFSWEAAHRQLEADRLRVPEHLSGMRPSTPNQYTLRDGRICDAETGLYDARWLYIPPEATGGIIPQMKG